MGVSRHDVCLLVGVEQSEHLLYVMCVSIIQRNMHTKHHILILRYECQILLQPLQLFVEEARFITRWGVVYGVDNISHTDDVSVATVERVVDRAKHILVCTLRCQLEGRTALVSIDWLL